MIDFISYWDKHILILKLIKIPNELITIKIFCIKINLFLEIIINRNIPYPPNFNIIEAKVIDT